ncbi:MFS transporter [Pedobacter rhizosphaerae]|uniref:Predicted arabinose efflux permease, MFS family n=1 Tax=Pedobacter rhizosphaerae TaxID=390241 RepID=A0A1H9RPD8_9SPHI|nr:MFS transporter [Pedobacter rhizosphaerae]SER74821.1 Predicted arabinose efflux permease, MFS family [Pedobacter rhizosphaerae]
MTSINPPKFVLPVIVIGQFLCTSLWFAGNAVLPDLVKNFATDPNLLANLTSMVQFGFIAGTLSFSLLAIADKFPPSKVFFICALAAAFFNAGICLKINDVAFLHLFRFLTGFMLAGIYPVGMKIASDYFKEGLGKSLGFLVGALVLGTAFPHLLKTLTANFHWEYVIYTTSFLAIIGGAMIAFFIPNGPFRKAGQQLRFNSFLEGFKNAEFRAVAFGYFGHMWELYTFWAFLPSILLSYQTRYPDANLNISLLTFLIIAAGGLSCMVGGLLSQRFGAKKLATIALLLSGLCCLLSPLFLFTDYTMVLLAILFFWGLVVTADSPLFSSLIAQHAPEASRGTSLTIVNCMGFALTIVSIQVINLLSKQLNSQYLYMILGLGPALGLWALKQSPKK